MTHYQQQPRPDEKSHGHAAGHGAPQSPRVFKICDKCARVWSARWEFLTDEEVALQGYRVNFAELSLGLFLFAHSCQQIIAIEAGVFRDLYEGETFTERMTGSQECPGLCLRTDKLQRCPAACECAWVREVMAVIGEMPKRKYPEGW